jgi:glutamyl-tRNA synthetase
MSVVTRFAPSPTGTLHIGNIRTALHNALWARAHGGRFWLRIDDTDAARSEEQYVEAIRTDLAWLGLTPDAMVRQSERFALYEQAFERLKAAGRVYPCHETPEELELRRKVLLGRGLPPVYERKPDGMPVPDGVAPHWRFRLDHDRPIEWDDRIRGPQRFDPARISDPVVRRADGSWLYLLPSVIDDIDMGITDVVRGEDHVSNSAVQLQMFEALGAPPPRFAHEALLVAGGLDAARDGAKLSKRDGASGVAELKARGIEPMALLSLLARLGTSQPVEPHWHLRALAEDFSFDHFGRAPAHYDPAEVEALNARLLHQAPYAIVQPRLPGWVGADDWALLRGELTRLSDLDAWHAVVEGELQPPPPAAEDRAFLAEAARIAAGLDWADQPWAILTAALKTATERKGKALFLPLRRALTGRDHGPEMAPLVQRIGKDRTLKRLETAA